MSRCLGVTVGSSGSVQRRDRLFTSTLVWCDSYVLPESKRRTAFIFFNFSFPERRDQEGSITIEYDDSGQP